MKQIERTFLSKHCNESLRSLDAMTMVHHVPIKISLIRRINSGNHIKALSIIIIYTKEASSFYYMEIHYKTR